MRNADANITIFLFLGILIDNLSAQASAFGITFKPSDFLKMNIKVTGTFSKPVVAPFFGSTTDVGQ